MEWMAEPVPATKIYCPMGSLFWIQLGKCPLKTKVWGRGWGQGGEMNQALYAHMNNKRKMKIK
jgi:hypothetical protein